MSAKLTVITPTTGKSGLDRLIKSIDSQTEDVGVRHILLWDNVRSPEARDPRDYETTNRFSIVAPAGFGRNGNAPGSRLRALGLVLAETPWVTFADDDVWWEPEHTQTTMGGNQTSNWITVVRRIWESNNVLIGVDRFESVGDSPSRAVPYEMCDGNTMLFRRELGLLAAPYYRETTEYNDDRLMYDILKKFGGERLSIQSATINQICPSTLREFFKKSCSPD